MPRGFLFDSIFRKSKARFQVLNEVELIRFFIDLKRRVGRKNGPLQSACLYK